MFVCLITFTLLNKTVQKKKLIIAALLIKFLVIVAFKNFNSNEVEKMRVFSNSMIIKIYLKSCKATL